MLSRGNKNSCFANRMFRSTDVDFRPYFLGYCFDIVEFDLDIGEYLMTDTSLTVIALFVMFGDLIHLGKVPQVKDPDSYEKSVWQIRCIIGLIMDGQILMNYQFL